MRTLHIKKFSFPVVLLVALAPTSPFAADLAAPPPTNPRSITKTAPIDPTYNWSGGRPIEASELLNSELILRLSEQRATLSAQLAGQSSTLLDGHPRIKELKARLADLDRQLREEASKVSRSLDNDARIAGGRADSFSASFEQLKKQASSTNGQDVQLRALERDAKAQRDLLESYLAKHREAATRENIDSDPSDGRIVSPATVSNIRDYPKKLLIVWITTLATFLLIVTIELLRMTMARPIAPAPVVSEAPLAPAAEPVFIEAPAATLAPLQVATRGAAEEPAVEKVELAPRTAGPDLGEATMAASGEALPACDPSKATEPGLAGGRGLK